MSSFEAHPLGWSLLLVVFMGIAMVKELMVDINRDFLRKSCSPKSTLRQSSAAESLQFVCPWFC